METGVNSLEGTDCIRQLYRVSAAVQPQAIINVVESNLFSKRLKPSKLQIFWDQSEQLGEK